MTFSVHRGEILHFLDDPGSTTTLGMDTQSVIQYYEDGLLFVEDGYIQRCGTYAELHRFLPKDAQPIQHKDGLIIPGMVDTHIHYPQCEVIASYGTQLIDWLNQYTFPAELKYKDPYYALDTAEFFLKELLRNGTTSALVFATVHPESVNSFFAAAECFNLRMICGKVLMDRNAPEGLCDTAESGYTDSAELIKKWHRYKRFNYAVTPRFAPTSSDQQLALAGRLLSEHSGLYLHTHLSENEDECKWVRELFPHNSGYLDVYDQHGLLGAKSVFAHGIHLDDSEWARLSETESKISFCPTSNLFIGSGLFNLKKADAFGVQVGLGTDVGGGDSLSLLRTINEAYKVQQLRGNNLSPFRSLYLATLGGARTLDLHQHIGNFAEGKEADFVVLDYKATPLIQYRLELADTIVERLFILQMLGDDRAVRETWIMGKQVHKR